MLHPSTSHARVTGDSHAIGSERQRWHDGEHPECVVADVARQPRLPAHVITLANEKGGVGKSTLAFQIAVSLAGRGHRVVAIDCDRNQQSLERALLNRDASARQLGIPFARPIHAVLRQTSAAHLVQEIQRLDRDADFVVIDTAGADSPIMRRALAIADTLVTPINGSFVDLDMLARIDPQTARVRSNGHFAGIVTAIRDARARLGLSSLDWVIMKNRARISEKRQQDRVDSVLLQIADKLDFRLIEPVRERVAFRQLTLYGLTYSDLKAIGEAPSGDGRADSEIASLIDDLRLPKHPVPPVRTRPPPHRRAPVIERAGDAYRDMLFNHA